MKLNIISILCICCASFSLILTPLLASDKSGDKSADKSTELEQAKEIVKKVNEGLVYLINEVKSKGEEKALEQFNKETPASVWGKGEMYFSTYNCAEYTVVGHPYKPLKGKKLLDLKDKKGKPFFKELCDTAKNNKDGGWVEYWWPKPGKDESVPFRKVAFIKGVEHKLADGTVRFYAQTAGVYSDTLTIKEVSSFK
ncbi:MAG: cache domain-containing protein [Oligoflexia bacterium]|nr:cache domain-containing protein [Oligoflexia bacterium]